VILGNAFNVKWTESITNEGGLNGIKEKRELNLAEYRSQKRQNDRAPTTSHDRLTKNIIEGRHGKE